MLLKAYMNVYIYMCVCVCVRACVCYYRYANQQCWIAILIYMQLSSTYVCQQQKQQQKQVQHAICSGNYNNNNQKVETNFNVGNEVSCRLRCAFCSYFWCCCCVLQVPSCRSRSLAITWRSLTNQTTVVVRVVGFPAKTYEFAGAYCCCILVFIFINAYAHEYVTAVCNSKQKHFYVRREG